MRLTLRNLLNYMNGQLKDPKDSEEIGKKIADSQFATELFHKVRDVMRRLRLSAPSITERGPNLDCNTVAEYLDNELPNDRVPDFEEVVLKSEMHLAEIASCHQILSMVLCEPAEIDPESRQRMYQLPTVANRDDDEHLAAVEAANMLSGDGHAALPAAAPVKARPRPVVPEYLRDPRKKSRLLPAAAIMLFVGAALGLLLVTVYPNALQWVQAKIYGKAADEARDDGDRKGPSAESAVAANGAAAAQVQRIGACRGQRIGPSRRQSPGSRGQARGRGSGRRKLAGETGCRKAAAGRQSRRGNGRRESGAGNQAGRPRARFSAGEVARRARKGRFIPRVESGFSTVGNRSRPPSRRRREHDEDRPLHLATTTRRAAEVRVQGGRLAAGVA